MISNNTSSESEDSLQLLKDEIKKLELKLKYTENESFITKEEFQNTSKKYLALLNEIQKKNEELKVLKEKTEEINFQLKEQVNRANEMASVAKSANAAKDVFLANISHEFRTPMNIIMGYSELLLELIKDEEIKKILGMVRKRSVDLLRLINDLMDISKIEAGKLSLVNEKTEIRVVISEIIKILHNEIRLKKLKIKINVDKKIPKYISVDTLRLRQILFNLISNSIKFTDCGYVSVSCQKMVLGKSQNESIGLLFRVSDTGIGIPKYKHSELFKPFVQIQESVTKKCGGTGLGLAISKKLVEMMGGNISVENNAPRGATFSFTIFAQILEEKQYAFVDTEQPKEVISKNKIIANQKINLLVVEDDENTLEMVVRIIKMLDENSNLNIITATNGQKAITIYYDGKIDFILTDMLMPIMDGYSLMSQIRSIENNYSKSTVMIAMTAFAMEEDKFRCLASGADFYICKPIRKEDFVLTMNRAIKKVMAGKPSLLKV